MQHPYSTCYVGKNILFKPLRPRPLIPSMILSLWFVSLSRWMLSPSSLGHLLCPQPLQEMDTYREPDECQVWSYSGEQGEFPAFGENLPTRK